MASGYLNRSIDQMNGSASTKTRQAIMSGECRRTMLACVTLTALSTANAWAQDKSMTSLEIPANFNPDVSMISRHEDTGTFHASRLGAEFAAKLVENGSPADIALAEKVLQGVKSCQELDPNDPHYGNYRWEMEDDAVEDLNAVHFVLIQLVPMMLRYQDRLSPSCQQSVLQSVQAALEEIERIDVGLEYTNIVLKDITNTILGGELLGNDYYVDRGKRKLIAWLHYTYRSGGVFELNSPVYTPLALRVLHTLSTHTNDPHVATQARLAANRIGLSYALRIHPETGRLAGPYSRAYRSHLLGENGSERAFLQAAADDEVLPDWTVQAMDAVTSPFSVMEGFDADRGLMYISWLSDSYAMGTAAKELDSQANRFIAGQSNVFTMNFESDDAEMGGMVYTRYLLDDKWLGDYRVTLARSNDSLLPDEGRFYGVQSESRCIGVYAPRELGAWQTHSSAKLALIVAKRDFVKEILVNDQYVETLPLDLPENAVVCLGFDRSFLAIRPFQRTDLGRNAPLRMVARGRELVLEIYNYLGPPKTFWELAYPGSFYQGQPQCAFFMEAAERSDFESLTKFAETIAAGQIIDLVDRVPQFSNRDQDRKWKLEYSRDAKTVGLEVDLMNWKLLRRWTESGDIPYRLLESGLARQSNGGSIEVAGAHLHASGTNMWLYGNQQQRRWILGGYGEGPTELELELPDRNVGVRNFRFGTITISDDEVMMDCNQEARLGHYEEER